MEKFFLFLNSIPSDKVMHFLVGSVTSTVVFCVALSLLSVPLAIVVALLVCLLLSVGKEVYDKLHQEAHTVDVWDAVATFSGAALAMLPVFISLLK